MIQTDAEAWQQISPGGTGNDGTITISVDWICPDCGYVMEDEQIRLPDNMIPTVEKGGFVIERNCKWCLNRTAILCRGKG